MFYDPYLLLVQQLLNNSIAERSFSLHSKNPLNKGRNTPNLHSKYGIMGARNKKSTLQTKNVRVSI